MNIDSLILFLTILRDEGRIRTCSTHGIQRGQVFEYRLVDGFKIVDGNDDTIWDLSIEIRSAEEYLAYRIIEPQQDHPSVTNHREIEL